MKDTDTIHSIVRDLTHTIMFPIVLDQSDYQYEQLSYAVEIGIK